MGIIVIIVPLLALAVNVFLKFVTDENKYSTGPVQAINFDEDIGDDPLLLLYLISHLEEVSPKMKCTLFLFIFVSPQRINQHEDFQHCLLYKSFIRGLMKRRDPPYLLRCTTS